MSSVVCGDYVTEIPKRELCGDTKAVFNFWGNADVFVEKVLGGHVAEHKTPADFSAWHGHQSPVKEILSKLLLLFPLERSW